MFLFIQEILQTEQKGMSVLILMYAVTFLSPQIVVTQIPNSNAWQCLFPKSLYENNINTDIINLFNIFPDIFPQNGNSLL